MKLKLFLMAVFLLLSRHDPVAAGSEATTAPHQQTAPDAEGSGEQALLHKRLGDQFASQGNYGKAADEFQLALSLDRGAFSRNERVRIATVLSWAKRFDAALAVLRPIVAEDPKNHDARVQLARVLSWSGKQGEAEQEADAVLADFPDSPEALLVKANVLRWKGDAAGAAKLYRKVLEGKEDFDARLGLAYAYLGTGDVKSAKETGVKLQPQTTEQESELRGLNKALCATKPVNAGAQYSHYRDSDHNIVDRFGISSGLRAGSGEAELGYRWTRAIDPVRHEKAREVWLSNKLRSGRLGVALGAGGYLTEDGGGFPTGFARTEWRAGGGSIGIGAAREALSDTAQLIEQKIMRTSGALSLSQARIGGVTFSENYTRSDYSDDNESDDLILAAQKRFAQPGPLKETGYRFRYLNFRRRSQGGYFDPADYTSHQIYTSLHAERGRFHADLEPSIGLQSFRRNGARSREGFFSVIGTAGWSANNCTSLEINGEGGNYAGGTTAGFAYYLVGLGLKASF